MKTPNENVLLVLGLEIAEVAGERRRSWRGKNEGKVVRGG